MGPLLSILFMAALCGLVVGVIFGISRLADRSAARAVYWGAVDQEVAQRTFNRLDNLIEKLAWYPPSKSCPIPCDDWEKFRKLVDTYHECLANSRYKEAWHIRTQLDGRLDWFDRCMEGYRR